MDFGQRAAVFLATGCCVGRIPWAPGTFGTLLGLPLSFFLSRISLFPAILGLVVFVLLAVWAAGKAESAFETQDPGSIVIDEVAGLLVTLVALPFTPRVVILGFVLFRVFDIVKPPPLRWMEKRLRGGWAVVADDIGAGVYSHILLRLVF